MSGPTRVELAHGHVDLAQQRGVIGGVDVHLTTKERDVLAHLAARPGQTVSREQLLVDVWQHPASASTEPVYSTIKRLRAKIDGGAHRHIHAVHGEGYRFEPPPSAPAPIAHELVGRGDALAALGAAVASGQRVITVVGPGGVGKTSLARAHATWAPGQDVAWCDLQATDGVEALLRAVATGLGVPLHGAEPAAWARGVADALAATPGALVVLDNAEQVAEPVASFVDGWRGGRFVVMSRESLRLPDELVLRIQPLSQRPAVDLFLARARQAGVPDVADADAVAIVERLDRLPLAIELAAAHAALLGVDALAASLDDQLAALALPRRGVPPRHATLRAAVAASWRLLGDEERRALTQVSVFEGGFAAAAAAAVLDLPALHPLAAVSALAERSLLRISREQGPPRFEAYASVRAFAAEQLDDAEAVRRRHAAWAAARGEALVAQLERRSHAAASAELSAEYANLVAAWRASHGVDPELAARLALVLDSTFGLVATSSRLQRDRLAAAREGLAAPALLAALHLAAARHELDPLPSLDAASDLARRHGYAELEARSLMARGELWSRRADLTQALECFDAALDLAERSGDARLVGRVLAARGRTSWTYGRVGPARADLDAALALHRAEDDLGAFAHTAATLAHVHRGLGDAAAAAELLADAARVAGSLGRPVGMVGALVEQGLLLIRTGDAAAGREAIEEAAEQYERLGLRRERALLHVHQCEALLAAGDVEGAAEEVRLATVRLRGLGQDVALSVGLEARGCVDLVRGDLDGAWSCFEEGLALARAAGSTRSEATLLAKRALVHAARGRFDAAWADVDQSVDLHDARGAPMMAGSSRADRAMIDLALGRPADEDLAWARRHLVDATGDEHARCMLDITTMIGEVWGQWRVGVADPGALRSEATARLEALLAQVAEGRRDVALRLSEAVARLAIAGIAEG